MDIIKKKLLEKESLIRLSDLANKELGRSMITSEIEGLVSFIKNGNFTKFKDVPLSKVEMLLSKSYTQRIKETLTNDQIDIRSLLIKEINRKGDEASPFSTYKTTPKNSGNGSSGNDNEDNTGTSGNGISGNVISGNSIVKMELDPFKWHQLNRELGRENLKREANFYFDSRYRDITVNSTDRYVFHFNNTYARQSGAISNIGNIRDIIEVECNQITLPFNNTTSNYYGQITMRIEQFKNAYISTEGPEFHFIFNTVVLPNNTVRLTPINPICRFREPITVLDDLTLVFKAPLTPVKFDKDRMTLTVNYLNPARFIAPEPHFLETGDVVYFTDFNTANPIGDFNIIQETNRLDGHIINKFSGTEFDIPLLDFTVITTPLVGFTPLVYFGSKRALIPLKFSYILPQKNVTDQ